MKYSLSPHPNDRDDRGVVTLELLLALPVLLGLIIGASVLGLGLAVNAQTIGLARDGARSASLNLTLPPDTVIVEGGCSDRDPTESVTVAATKTVPLRGIPFLPVSVFLDETITKEVTMRCGG